MTGKFVLAHDLGTTGNKASLYDEAGRVVSSAFYGYETLYPHHVWAEQDPEDWWKAVCTTTRQLLALARIDSSQVACLSFSGQMMGCVPVDQRARPQRSAIIWADQRAVEQAQRLAADVGWEEAYQITGHRLSPSYSGPKILWVREHQPEIFAATYKFLQPKDFIIARLTGNFVTDFSDASGTNLYDLTARAWSGRILEASGLDPSVLPELHASTDVVGEVLPPAGEEASLAPGTPVVIGGGDGACASAGAGVVREGTAYNYLGSSSWIAIASPAPIFDPGMRTFNFAHVAPGMFMPCGTMQAAGGSYQWLRDVICQPEKEVAAGLGLSPYELMNLQAESSPPGAKGLLFLPYLLGERSPRWNPEARGAYLGLTVQHNRADIVRATLEGISFNLRAILEAFQEQGARPEAMRVIGGGARGRLWRQILADIYGLPVHRLALLEEATSLGAALAGGIGVGLYKDFRLAESFNPVVDAALPNPANKDLYDRLYQLFNQSYEACAPLYQALAEL